MEYNNLVKSYKSYLRQKLYESDTPYPRAPEVSDPDQPPNDPDRYDPETDGPYDPDAPYEPPPAAPAAPAAKPAAKPAAAPDEVQVITKAAQRADDEANKKPRARGFKTSQGDARRVPYRN